MPITGLHEVLGNALDAVTKSHDLKFWNIFYEKNGNITVRIRFENGGENGATSTPAGHDLTPHTVSFKRKNSKQVERDMNRAKKRQSQKTIKQSEIISPIVSDQNDDISLDYVPIKKVNTNFTACSETKNIGSTVFNEKDIGTCTSPMSTTELDHAVENRRDDDTDERDWTFGLDKDIECKFFEDPPEDHSNIASTKNDLNDVYLGLSKCLKNIEELNKTCCTKDDLINFKDGVTAEIKDS